MKVETRTLYERLGGYDATAAVNDLLPGSGPIRSLAVSGRIAGKTVSIARSSSLSTSSARVLVDRCTIAAGIWCALPEVTPAKFQVPEAEQHDVVAACRPAVRDASGDGSRLRRQLSCQHVGKSTQINDIREFLFGKNT